MPPPCRRTAAPPTDGDLIRLRQVAPAWRVSPDCDFPVAVGAAAQAGYSDLTPCNAGVAGQFAIYAPKVTAASFAQATAPAGTVMVTPGSNTASSIVQIASLYRGDRVGFNSAGINPPGDTAGAKLVPAGLGGVAYDDRPLTYALDDARAAAVTAMSNDTAAACACRNTVVVLITSGKDSGDSAYLSSHNVATKASTFLSVTGGGVTKRVPIVVIGVKPAAADEAQLQTIATNSGGFYLNVTSVAEVTAAVNRAVQLGFARSADFDLSKASEFLPVSPVIGSVNLEGRVRCHRQRLSNTDITAVTGGQKLPQRSNFMITAGFSLPGFDGRHPRVPHLQAGARPDQADRVEVRLRRHAALAGSRRPAIARRSWRGRSRTRTHETSTRSSRTGRAADRWWRSPPRTRPCLPRTSAA